MSPLEFVATASVFSMLGYAFCYLTLSTFKQSSTSTQEPLPVPDGFPPEAFE